MGDKYGEILAEQAGSQASGMGVGAIFDIALQGWRNKNQLKQNQKLMEQSIAGSKEMGIFNREQALQMWNDTNAGAQMEHLKKAGLNPALMYGGSGAGGATAATASGNVSGGMADPRSGGGYTGMNIMMPAQVKLMEAQARNLDADTQKKLGADTKKITTETTGIEIQNKLNELDLKMNENTFSDRVNKIAFDAIESFERGVGQRISNEINEASKDEQINKIKAEAINALLQREVMQQGIKVSQAQINKMSADISQKGRELDISEFIAEVNANQPELGKIVGGLLNSSKEKIDRILKLGKEYTKPRQVGQ